MLLKSIIKMLLLGTTKHLMYLENQKILLKNTMPTGGTCNDEFPIFLLYRSITDISP